MTASLINAKSQRSMSEMIEMPKAKPLYIRRRQPRLEVAKPHKGGSRENNKLQIQDRAIHQWYRFVLPFPAHLVRDYLAAFHLGEQNTVLDPFCGTGTTLIECKKMGIASFGLESNPVVNFASQTKLRWDVPPKALLAHALKVAAVATRILEGQGLVESGQGRLCEGTSQPEFPLRTLPEESADLLLTDSISILPLHRTLVLLDTLAQHQDSQFIDHERLALADALVSGISNLHFGPEVGIGPAKPDAPVVALWLDKIRAMVQDLENLPAQNTTPATVYRADAREVASALRPGDQALFWRHDQTLG